VNGADDFVIAAMLEAGALDPTRLEAARKYGAEHGVGVCESLTTQGLLSVRELSLFRAETSEYPFVDLANYDIDYGNTSRLPRAAAEQLCAFPLFLGEDLATVGMANPLDLRAVDQLRALLKADIDPVLCEAEAIRSLIDRAYAIAGDRRAGAGAGEGAAGADVMAEDLAIGKEPIVAAVNQIVAQGIDLGASDIHINPDEHNLHLRYRVDGTLQNHQGPSIAAHAGIVQRLKVMADLDLTQTRRPQDGKFRYTHGGRSVDIRLSLVPTVCGENVVMRLLSSAANIRDFTSLGFPQDQLSSLEQVIENPYGMILVTGPTGSGKTTTLYTALKRLNAPDVNILTIEDPVEIRLPLIRQVQVNHEIGLTFASALRSILRQDPDVVFVGEIRDEETARISLQAALTGHLVLSSLHTNDAAGAIPRLRDLGCPGFAINAALLAVVAQRLVRRLCPECARACEPEAVLCQRFGARIDEVKWMRGSGCGRCGSTGYRGRIGVYEMLRMTPEVSKAVDRGNSAVSIREIAVAEGMRLMWQDGLVKAKLGLTTLEELNRVVAVQATEAKAAPPPARGGCIRDPDAAEHGAGEATRRAA
jgi:type IV pilus assembly protein PilB